MHIVPLTFYSIAAILIIYHKECVSVFGRFYALEKTHTHMHKKNTHNMIKDLNTIQFYSWRGAEQFNFIVLVKCIYQLNCFSGEKLRRNQIFD